MKLILLGIFRNVALSLTPSHAVDGCRTLSCAVDGVRTPSSACERRRRRAYAVNGILTY